MAGIVYYFNDSSVLKNELSRQGVTFTDTACEYMIEYAYWKSVTINVDDIWDDWTEEDLEDASYNLEYMLTDSETEELSNARENWLNGSITDEEFTEKVLDGFAFSNIYAVGTEFGMILYYNPKH